MITITYTIGIISILALIIAIGYFSGKRVKDASFFATGNGKANQWIVCGGIMGTLVSGQATIGTAQLAFHYGLSAWWFTLGSALGCVMLAVIYAKPIRKTGCSTLLEVIGKKYGKKAETTGSILSFIGIFISILAQILASSALLSTIFPIRIGIAYIISILLMMAYVIWGGIWGAGIGGLVKTVLLYICVIVAGGTVLILSKGISGLNVDLTTNLTSNFGTCLGISTPEDINHRFFNLLARGPFKDFGSGISLMLGVIATQTYAQCVWSGKNDKSGVRGSMMCVFLIPPIGAACTLIGLYMRSHYFTIEEFEMLKNAGLAVPIGMRGIETSLQVFPTFVINHLPHWFGGIVLGTLLLTVIGGGAGLTLGASTILVRDVWKNIFPNNKRVNSLTTMRLTLASVLIVGFISVTLVSGSFINDLGFLSLGLRAAAVLCPLSFALFYKEPIGSKWIIASMFCGSISLLIAQFAKSFIDPIFWGIAAALICCGIGCVANKRKTKC